MRWALLIALALTAGCETLETHDLKPVASVEVMYAFPFSSDYWVHQDQPWTCEPPQVRFEFGLEHRNGWEAGAYHESFLLCGTFNTKAEIFENGIYLKKTFGGW